MRTRPLFAVPNAGLLALLASAGLLGCGPSSVPDPFAFDAGYIPPDGGAEDAPTDAPPTGSDPEIGGPCLDDGQCNDEIPCTFDECDTELLRCRFSPDDSACQNGVYCDGVERCLTKIGCLLGEPVGCSDPTPCTIDACDEATQTCTHEPRDADGDGDPDIHCPGGKDCDDADPSVSSVVPEACGNGKDDNCNKVTDESACTSPAHDTCADPLEISAPGTYAMDTTGAAFDYATSCSPEDQGALRDVVAAIVLPAGPLVDVEVTARTSFAEVAVTLAGLCGDASSEIACGGSFASIQGGKIAKLRGRSLGDPNKSTALPLYVTTTPFSPVTVDVAFLPPSPVPTNETCGTAAPITPGVPVKAEIIGVVEDIESTCKTPIGELVYSFELTETSNVDVYASSIDGDGLPSLSLRDPECSLLEDEIACQSSANAHVFWQSLPAGTYYVAVSASAPTTAAVTLEISAPTVPSPDDKCETAPPIAPNTTINVGLGNHQDDVYMGCVAGMVDAAYALDLAEASDVLLVERISQGDLGAVTLADPACADASDQIVCVSGSPSPIRAAKHAVPAGSYRVVAESLQGQPVQLTAFVRKAVAPTLVLFADSCDDAFEIPPEGGFFQGTTANANPHYNAGCDQGGVPEGGAPDQILKLTLAAPKRVVLAMDGSAYTTLLDVRKGPECPGTEIVQGCAVGFAPRRSFLDLSLDPGVYYLQIDGYALDKGPWFLDVRVVDP